MRICLECGAAPEPGTWVCAGCGHEPSGGGFRSFLGARDNTHGFDEGLFRELTLFEERNFWFRGRNDLLAWSLGTHFPRARSFFELGCGTGFVLRALRDRFPKLELSGADLYVSALELARERVPDVPLYRIDATAIPFRDEFDVLGAFDVLEHVDHDEAALREICSAVRPGGGVILTVPQHRWLWGPPDVVAHHRRRYGRSELLAKLGRAGLGVVRVTSFASTVLPAMVAARAWYRFRPGTYSLRRELDLPAPLDRLLSGGMSLEQVAIRAGLSLPAGGSLLVVAQRAEVNHG